MTDHANHQESSMATASTELGIEPNFDPATFDPAVHEPGRHVFTKVDGAWACACGTTQGGTHAERQLEQLVSPERPGK